MKFGVNWTSGFQKYVATNSLWLYMQIPFPVITPFYDVDELGSEAYMTLNKLEWQLYLFINSREEDYFR